MTDERIPTPLLEAWQAALAEFSNPGTDADADMGTYKVKYTTLAALLDHVRPVLARHDLAVFHDPGGTDGYVTVQTVIVHKTGVLRSAEFTMSAGRGAQAAGSAMSYARRYSLAAMCGIATDLDDDGKAAQASTDSLASAGQIRALAIALGEAGIKARADKIAWIEKRVGHKVATSKELTIDEAKALLEELARTGGRDE